MTQETYESEFQMSYADAQDPEIFHYYTGHNYGPYVSDASIGADESNFWSSSPRSDSSSPNVYVHNSLNSSQNMYKPMPYSSVDHHLITCRNGYPQITITDIGGSNNVPFVRVIKRRSTANKKERKRTQSINKSYADLRMCIPNVPADTKLSKIKTLRLATSYINYLTKALESNDPAGGFKAELGSLSRKTTNNNVDIHGGQMNCSGNEIAEDSSNQRRVKGRTGWPQHVWALELKQEQTL